MTALRLNKIFAPVLLLSVMALQCLWFARSTGQTSDEPFYFALGYSGLTHQDYTFQTEHPPLMPQIGALALLPLKLSFPFEDRLFLEDGRTPDTGKTGLRFLYQKGNDADRMLFFARLPIIMTTLLLGLILFIWSYQMFGSIGAIISLVLYSFCPNMISHGSLFATDSGVAVFFFAAFFCLQQYFRSNSQFCLVAAAMCSGLAVASKISGFIVLPVAALILLTYLVIKPQEFDSGNAAVWQSRGMVVLAWLLLVLALGHKVSIALVVPACIPFIYQSSVLKKYPRVKTILCFAIYIICLIVSLKLGKKGMHSLSHGLMLWAFFWGIAWWIQTRQQKNFFYQHAFFVFSALCLGIFTVMLLVYLDLPQMLIRFKAFNHLILALKNSISHTEGGHKMCVDGSFIKCDYRYFTQVMLIKTPITSLVLTLIGTVLLFYARISKLDKLMILIPPVIFLIIASFANKINIGHRHVIAVYPFMYLVSGSIGKSISRFQSLTVRTIFFSLTLFSLVYYAWNSLLHLPNHLSYFNEWVGSVENGAKLTSDSNVVWGQDNRSLAMWAKSHQLPLIHVATKFQNLVEYSYYGMTWKSMEDKDFLSPSAGYYAIDVEVLGRLPDESIFKQIQPLDKAGETISIFQID